jgi:oxygen-independent coproporphyrinogen-3 oxidase
MAGIYIHIPFCKQACTYCDFHFSTTFSVYRKQLIDSICQEIKQEKNYLEGKSVETIYFGGGTPSLLTKEEIEQLLTVISSNFNVLSSPEITLEANPDDINDEQLKDWQAIGINRLSIGLQSFLQEDLDWMNRAHNANESKEAVELAKSYGFNLTIDLIYGLPSSNIERLADNLKKAVALTPDHISAYCLTVEQSTALHHWVKTGKIIPVNEDEQAEQFAYLVNFLSHHGYHQYEISNFARQDAFSKHNSNYWKGVSYLGVGPSAHSFNGISRRWNSANNKKYISLLEKGETQYEQEYLSPKDRFNEYLMTGLRTVWGVDLEKLNAIHSLSSAFNKTLDHFKQHALVFQKDGVITLSEKGKLQADYIASSLFV